MNKISVIFIFKQTEQRTKVVNGMEAAYANTYLVSIVIGY